MRRAINFFILFLVFLLSNEIISQEAIHNFGNLKLHQKGSLGFHTDLINDGIFDENKGLVGFYSTNKSISIGGALQPSFFDFEMGAENGLHLKVGLSISNSLYWIYGNVHTDKTRKNLGLYFEEEGSYEGAAHNSKVDGYSSIKNKKEFTFPIGNKDFLKPLSVKFIDDTFYGKCAYFQESPNYPQSFAMSFDTSKKDPGIETICPSEFWNLNSSGRIQVTLNWNGDTPINYYTESVENVTITGWNRNNNQWDDLGQTASGGNLTEGWVTSEIFNANDYEIFTFGFKKSLNKNEAGNYALTPNGDGINDFFTLDILKKSPTNELQVFNRAGQLVYKKTNYSNEFQGRGNHNIFNPREYLEEGVYFYLLDLKDLNLKYQGYFYLLIE